MKKVVKQKILQVLAIGVALMFALGGLGGSVYYLYANAKQQEAYQEAMQAYLDEYMANLASQSATVSADLVATPGAEAAN
jgi:uncharacterized membrane protein YukC